MRVVVMVTSVVDWKRDPAGNNEGRFEHATRFNLGGRKRIFYFASFFWLDPNFFVDHASGSVRNRAQSRYTRTPYLDMNLRRLAELHAT